MLDFIGSKPLDQALERQLNQEYGPATKDYAELMTLLRTGIDDGWACHGEITGPDYRRGRIAAPSADTYGFSVETGMLRNVLRTYHRHPHGEISMIGPVDETGQFCGAGAGWKVFEPAWPA